MFYLLCLICVWNICFSNQSPVYWMMIMLMCQLTCVWSIYLKNQNENDRSHDSCFNPTTKHCQFHCKILYCLTWQLHHKIITFHCKMVVKLSRSTSLLLRVFLEIQAFITSYSDEALCFKWILIKIKAIIIKKHISFMQSLLLNYSHLLSRSTSSLLRLFFEIKAFIASCSDEVLYFKGVLIEIRVFIIKKHTLVLQTSLKTITMYDQKATSLLLKLFIEIKVLITFYSDEVLYFKGVLIELKAFIIKKYTFLI